MAITATVDRVDEGRIRLLIGEYEVEVPRSELPEGAEKGDVLTCNFTLAQRTEAGAWKEPGREEG